MLFVEHISALMFSPLLLSLQVSPRWFRGIGVGVSSFFYPQCGVEAVPASGIDTLHITGFGLSSPLSCAELLQDWLWPPLLPGSVISFAHRSALRTDSVSISKPAANLPTLADTHSSQSRQDRPNTYGGKKRRDPNRTLLISTPFFSFFFFFFCGW